MPISKANEALYPGGSIRSPEWLALREVVRERAGDCCEACGVRNLAIGIRMSDGEFMEIPGYAPGDVIELLANMAWGDIALIHRKVIRIVCTVAHVDEALVDHSLGNLRFWCQKCHNSHDAKGRAIRAAATRKARKPVTLLDLMEGRT